MMMPILQQNRPISAARWKSRDVGGGGSMATAKSSLSIGASVLKELEQMAQKLNLGEPVYKIAGGTSSGRGYFCSVNIHGHQAGSLDEYVTPEQAQYAAALNAVNLLKTYYGEKLNPSTQHLDNSWSFNETVKRGDEAPKNAAAIFDSENDSEQTMNGGDDFERVAENLLVLLSKMPRGIYSHALSLKYLEMFQQNLPGDWLARIKDGYPEFSVEEVDAFRSIVAKRHVKGGTAKKEMGAATAEKFSAPRPTPLAPSIAESAPVYEQSSTSPLPESPRKKEKKSEETTEVISDKEAISNATPKVRFNEKIDEKLFCRQPGEEDDEIIQPPPFNHPPPFCLPENDNWHVFVSVVKTPADFTVRLLGEEYSEQYEQLQRDMQDFYESGGLGQKLNPTSSSDAGSLENLLDHVYAARAEECWHRVYLNEIIPADEGIAEDGVMASVYFIDHGDYETVSLDDLRILEQKFMRLPCQAAHVCLAGFEHFAVEDFLPEMIDRFREITLAKIMIAQYTGNIGSPMGDGGDAGSTVGPFLLALWTPSEIDNLVVGENSSDNANAAESKKSALMINQIIMQMSPKVFLNKISSAGMQNEINQIAEALINEAATNDSTKEKISTSVNNNGQKL